MTNISQNLKPAMDIASVVAWVSVLAGQMTLIIGLLAAIASLAWGLIRIYETRTVQGWFRRMREKRK